MFVDLVSLTVLSEQLDVEVLGELLCRFKEVCSTSVVQFGGQAVDFMSDGGMINSAIPMHLGMQLSIRFMRVWTYWTGLGGLRNNSGHGPVVGRFVGCRKDSWRTVERTRCGHGVRTQPGRAIAEACRTQYLSIAHRPAA